MKKKNITSWLFALVLTGVFFACNEEVLIDKYEVYAPELTGFSPISGEAGTEITITGKNLQRVDAVTIGDGVADILYKIDGETMVVTVASTSRSGKITISNIKGSVTSTEDYTISYATPTIESYPEEGTVNEDIVITGSNLNVIEEVTLGGIKASIISKRKNEIVFKVPFSEVEEPVSLRFSYFNGSSQAEIGPTGNTFTVLKEKPEAIVVPTSLTKYAPVSIEGERLSLIEAIYIGEIKALIKFQTDELIQFDMPTNYFGGNMTGELKGIYYGVRELIFEDNFQVYADPNEPRYYRHNNVLLSSRVNYGGTEDAFFDAETGIVYHSCAAFDNRRDIDFYLYDQSGYVQLYGPHNGGTTIKNFKCEGKSIDAQDGSWNDFYGTGGIETKFKVLSKDSANHLPIINAFEAGTIIELTDELFAGINLPGTSSPRIYLTADDKNYNVTSGHLAVDRNNIGWVRNFTTGKNGIIKITGMPKEAVNGRIPELTFDIIWAK